MEATKECSGMMMKSGHDQPLANTRVAAVATDGQRLQMTDEG